VTRIWPSQAAEAPIPTVGQRTWAGDFGSEILCHPLDYHGEAAGLVGGEGFGNDPGALGVGAALGLEAAVDIGGLRAEANVGHDRDAALDEVTDGGGGVFAGLDLHGLTAGFLHDAGGVHEGLLDAGLVRAEGHVDDDEGLLRGTHHGLAVQDHHLERDADRGGQAVDDHADAIADEQEIAATIQQLGHGGGVGREADQRRRPLGGGDVADRLPAGLDLGGHGGGVLWQLALHRPHGRWAQRKAAAVARPTW
jgi:hypothetical protein